MIPERAVLPARLLMGSGPANPDPRVLRAMAAGLVGQFDPAFTALMEETQTLLRQVLRTASPHAFPVPGTSRAGMEAAVVSLVEPGEPVLVVENGRFGLLFEEIARRAGAVVDTVRAPWGVAIDTGEVERALAARPPVAVLVVHGETSTGVLNPVPEIAAAAHRHGALVVVDAVCTVGGAPLDVDGWELDVCVGGTQKCLGCPSGLAPVTYGEAAAARLRRRRSTIRSNYLDLTQLARYWSPERLNHHTAPTSMIFGLHEACRLIVAETLPARHARHRVAGQAMQAGLLALGLRRFGVPPGPDAMPMLHPVEIPPGVDDAALRARLLAEHGVEIMGAFGTLAGRIWRIGTMGYNARPAAVFRTLAAIADTLPPCGDGAGPRRAALDAARACFEGAPVA